jgi:hypothetical protein
MEEINADDIPISFDLVGKRGVQETCELSHCKICMNDEVEIVKLNCSHSMCSSCIVNLYSSKCPFVCPFCRCEIKSNLSKLETVIQLAKFTSIFRKCAERQKLNNKPFDTIEISENFDGFTMNAEYTGLVNESFEDNELLNNTTYFIIFLCHKYFIFNEMFERCKKKSRTFKPILFLGGFYLCSKFI